MKVVQAYAPTFSHDDEEIERLCEYVKLAIRKEQTQYTAVTDDFNAKLGKRQAERIRGKETAPNNEYLLQEAQQQEVDLEKL